MDIPYQAIPAETLSNIIEEYVTREGTDYGDVEYSLADKVAQLTVLLKAGKAVIQYDESLEICEILVLTS